PYMVKEKSVLRAQKGFLTILYGVSLVVLVVFYILRRPLLAMFSGNSGQFVDVASALMAIILFGQFVTSLNSVSAAYLQCKDCFITPKLLALMVTVAATAVIYLAEKLNIYQYATLSFMLILVEMVVQYAVAIYKGFRYSPCVPYRDPELRHMFCTFLPTVFGSGVYQLTLMTDSLISSTLGEGNISVLSYAGTISGMINTVIASNIMLYIYPKIAAEVNDERGKKKLFQYMTFFAAVMCAVIVLFAAAGYDAVRILFERGAFRSDATKGVFICVLIYLLGAPINIMRDVVYRYFYSKGNTKSTFYNGLSASILNMVISIVLARFIGLYGVVLGTTITAVFSFISILLRMKKQYTFGGNFIFFAGELGKIIVATGSAVIACVFIKLLPLSWPSLAVSLLSAVVVVVIFVVMLLLTRAKVFYVDLG
ncbi:MAG: polysaccharide biosynthesis C-terminal domain-containing protein, partial [Roseburia sp.]|nr:polysaccharide biosynthesis C-terminal domain-containing protein [Roseburia sp.]